MVNKNMNAIDKELLDLESELFELSAELDHFRQPDGRQDRQGLDRDVQSTFERIRRVLSLRDATEAQKGKAIELQQALQGACAKNNWGGDYTSPGLER